jgi:hypothetical protein
MNPEKYHGGAERSQKVEKAASERKAELEKQNAEHGELLKGREREIQEAHTEAHKEARAAAEYNADDESKKPKDTYVASAERDKSYKQTLSDIQSQMSGPSRSFSKIIHNKTVEKVSDVVGSTIARPNAVLAGAICAFVVVLGLYVHARYSGYALRGSETIAAFVIGWLLGMLFDLLRGLFRSKR